MRMIAAETLGLALEHVQLISDDSSETPNMGSVSASRMTLMGGRAAAPRRGASGDQRQPAGGADCRIPIRAGSRPRGRDPIFRSWGSAA